MKKRVCSLLLALVMALSLLPTVAVAETTSLTGAGTEASPYQIGTLAELQFMAAQVNGGAAGYDTAWYELTADITASFTDIIGNDDDYSFKGHFDGKGHTVNLDIESNNSYVGLFGYNEGTIVNVITTGTVACSGASGTVGCVCAYNWPGTIANCINSASAKAGAKGGIGGVCGRNQYGTIVNCVNIGTASGGAFVGGVCTKLEDLVSSKITNCYYDNEMIIGRSAVNSKVDTADVCGLFTSLMQAAPGIGSGATKALVDRLNGYIDANPESTKGWLHWSVAPNQYPVLHEHNFTYEAEGNVLSAVCAATGCPIPESKLTLTMSAPDNSAYNGKAKSVRFADGEETAWLFGMNSIPTVEYYLADGTTKTTTANSGAADEGFSPVWGGSYVAEMTVGDATAKLAFTVSHKLTDIEVTTPPTKTAYTAGDDFDKTGMVVTATYDDGATATVTDFMVLYGSNLKKGQTSVTILYAEGSGIKTDTVSITVGEALAHKLSDIKVTTAPTKTAYTAGDDFDKTGMVVTATYEDGATATVTDLVTVMNGSNLKKGQTSVTILYADGSSIKTDTVTITVGEGLAHKLSRIEVTTAPTKTTYTAGDDFDKTGMVVTATYEDGATATVTDLVTVMNGSNLKKNQTSVTILYAEGSGIKTDTVNITVGEALAHKLSGIEVTTAPNKITYTAGDDFVKTGMVVTATYEDGATATVTDFVVVNGSNLKKGQTSVTILYADGSSIKTDTVSITVTGGSDSGDGGGDDGTLSGFLFGGIVGSFITNYFHYVAAVLRVLRHTLWFLR